MDDLRAALRSLRSTPGPTLVVLFTLAVAIAANAAVFSVVSGVLLRPLGYGGDDARLMVPWATSGGDDTFRLSPADYRDLRDEVDAFDGQVALYRYIGSTLSGGDEPARVGSLAVTPQLFRVLRTAPALGGLMTEADGRPGSGCKAVLTHASWTRRFGSDPGIVGAALELDGSPCEVVGVAEAGFRFPPGDAEVEVYFNMRLGDEILLDRDHRMFDGVARLADGVGIDAARNELDVLATRLAREYPDTNEGWGMTIRPLRDEVLGDVGATLWVLAGAVFLVLVVACANIANVLIARSTVVAREYAVRAALGAGRADLARRSLVESLVLGAVGGVAGVLVGFGFTGLLRAVLPGSLPRAQAVTMDFGVLAYALLASLLATVAFGALPALRAMTPELATLLKPTGASGGAAPGGRRVREAMVVFEVAVAIVLLVGAGLMVRSFARLSDVDPGFRREGLVAVAVQLPTSRLSRSEWRPFFERLVDRARALPGVEAAGAVSDLPMSSVGLGLELEFGVEGLDAVLPGSRPNADFRLVTPGYFEAMGMEIVGGRRLDRLDAVARRPVAVVNQTLVARYFPDVDPVGRTMQVASVGKVEVVGVVSDIRHGGLQGSYESEAYLPYGLVATAEMHVVVASSQDPSAIAAGVEAALREQDSRLVPSQVATISALLWESVAQPRFNTALLAALAACAGLLAAVGIYGVVAYSVARRRSEIGVRIALGADADATVGLIVRQALGIVIVGAGLGLFGALGGSRLLAGMLFDVGPGDPLTYAAVLAGTLLVGLLAAWLPARRATRIDPVATLHED